jgi:hypothetical protein
MQIVIFYQAAGYDFNTFRKYFTRKGLAEACPVLIFGSLRA